MDSCDTYFYQFKKIKEVDQPKDLTDRSESTRIAALEEMELIII